MERNIVRYKYKAGMASSKLSILSKIPPWPGIIFPESFTELVRLIRDSNKSPIVPNSDTTIAKPIQKATENTGK